MTPVTRAGEKNLVYLYDPIARLERAFIEAYLKEKGYTWRSLRKMPADKARRLRIEASMYASGKLAEIESRAAVVTEMHSFFMP